MWNQHHCSHIRLLTSFDISKPATRQRFIGDVASHSSSDRSIIRLVDGVIGLGRLSTYPLSRRSWIEGLLVDCACLMQKHDSTPLLRYAAIPAVLYSAVSLLSWALGLLYISLYRMSKGRQRQHQIQEPAIAFFSCCYRLIEQS